MADSTNEHYTTFTRGVPTADVMQWEKDMGDAEARRMQDRTVMDIIGATQPPAERSVQPMQWDIGRGPIEEWIQLALTIEEKQSVYTVRCS